MKPHDVIGVFASIVVLATVTTLVLPNRQTTALAKVSFAGFGNVLNAGLGGQLPKYAYTAGH